MSALEQIRQRPVLTISILAGALLLFILTAVDRPGELLFDHSTVAKVDGQKIDYVELQRRVEQYAEQMRNANRPVDQTQLQSRMLQQMIQEALFNNEVNKLGIVVTDNELSQAMLGDNPHPAVLQLVRQMGVPTPMDLYNAAYNPKSMGLDEANAAQFQQAWMELEKNARQLLLEEKFSNLFSGVFVANELDAKAYYDNVSGPVSTIAYARTDYSSLSDDDFKPSDADIEDLYNQEKELFRLSQPQYLVDFISVSVVPSQTDLAAGSAEVAKAIAELKVSEGTTAVDDNAKFMVNHIVSPKSGIDGLIRTNLDKIVNDTVVQLPFNNDTYTIVKLLGTTQQTDSVLLDMAQIANEALADSVINLLNGGVAPKNVEGDLIGQTLDSVWVALTAPNAAFMKAELDSATVGKYFMSSSQPGVAMKLRTRKAPVTVYDLAEISYQVVPSGSTAAQINGDFEKFLAANTTPAKFKAEAEKKGYMLMEGYVTPEALLVVAGSGPYVNPIPETEKAATWTLNNKAGKVSGVFRNSNETLLMGVAIKDVYKGKYKPVTDTEVRDYLTNKLRNRMKGDKLVKDYTGKATDLAGYATAMKTSVDTTKVSFGQPMIANFAYGDYALNANVAVAKKGQLVGPLALNSSVVVFQVVDVDNSGREFDFATDALSFNQREGAGALQQRLPAILLGNKKVDYRLSKFGPKTDE